MRWTGPLALGLSAALAAGGCTVSADATVVSPGAQAGAAVPSTTTPNPSAVRTATSTTSTTSATTSTTGASAPTSASPLARPSFSIDPAAWANDALVPGRLAPAAPTTVATPAPEAGSPPVPQPLPGAPVPPGEAARLIIAPCRVALLADSVGHDLLLNGLGQALAGVGCPITWSRVQRGSPLVDGVRALAAAGAGPADVIVVLQGYSKASSHRAEFPSLVDQVLRTANGRKVVWTLYGRTSDCSAGYSATLAGFNQHLLATAQRAPNLRVIDYPALIGAHPEYSQHRCPHLLDSGSAAVAPWMAAEVRRLVNIP